jgi:hypothetical protein
MRAYVLRREALKLNVTALTVAYDSWAGVRLSPLGTSTTNWPIVPAPDHEYGTYGGMRIGRGNRSIRRKHASVPLCLPQIPHDLT